MSSTLSPLAHPRYRSLWFTSLTCNTGNAILAVGAGWLLTAAGERPDVVALVQTASTLPVMLLAVPAGALADMHDRRRIMLCAQLFMATLSFGLMLLAGTDAVHAPAVLLLTLVIGAGIATYNPAMQASIGGAVPRSELASAIALNILAFNVARSLGPAVGGALVAAGGSRAAFAVNTLSYLLAAVILWRWRPSPQTVVDRVPLHRAIAVGLRHYARSPALRVIGLRSLAFTLCGGAAWALMPLVARDLVGGGSIAFGLLLGALGLGSVVGAAASTWLRHNATAETITRVGGLIYGLGCLAAAARPGLWPTFLALVIAGAGWVQSMSGFGVAAQLWAPRDIVGRITAAQSSVIFGGLALSSWGWGHVAAVFGTASAIGWSGALMMALPLLGILLPMPLHEAADHH